MKKEQHERIERERKYSSEMEALIKRAYGGELSLLELRKSGMELIEELMDKDPEGYDGDSYIGLKDVFRELDSLHDAFTRDHYREHKEEILDMIGCLK